ncbi:DUF7344 domain-containing protein [Halalkalicoccus salilacus]|uniref:DUF7344 domain-containing protein n=1 Tax=Halalkalicoccus TaxID=332246 RepID=UPI002F96E30A
MSIDVTGSDPLAKETHLSLAERFSLLADPHRRAVLERLDRTADGLEVEALAARVAAELSDAAPGTVDEDHRRRVLLALHHNHLPKLADHGLLEYDLDAGIVTAT